MDLSTALAAAPYAKKAWKFVPQPMKLPLIAAGLFYVWYSRRKGDPDQPKPDQDDAREAVDLLDKETAGAPDADEAAPADEAAADEE